MISKIAVKRLREIYLSETITVYLRDMNIVSVNEEQQEVRISPMLEGICIDIDSEFIYLGLPDGSIMRTIPHATVGLIEISFVGGEMIDADLANSDEEIH